MSKLFFSVALLLASYTQAVDIQQIINNSDQNAYLIEYNVSGKHVGKKGQEVAQDDLSQSIILREDPAYQADSALVLTRGTKSGPHKLRSGDRVALATKAGITDLDPLKAGTIITINQNGTVK